MSATGSPSPEWIKSQKYILGHPAGLFLLAGTEMWERFSYYGMRSILVLYMTDYLFKGIQAGTLHVAGFAGLKGFLESIFGPMTEVALASQVYGLYGGFVWFTPFFGGMLADRVIGQRKTVVIGGILMAIGLFMLMSEALFLPALVMLILGVGCFKPNISTQVGSLYAEGDPRRDSAYTIFYTCFNVGAFLSPLICGTLGQLYAWKYGFMAAGIGMLLGLTIYLAGQKLLAPDLRAQTQVTQQERRPLNSSERKAVIGLCVLCALNIVFWGVYEQQGNSMQLFADRNADWHVFGWEMPSTWFQAFNSFFIFGLGPILNWWWAKQARKGTEPDSIMKMALGCVFLGISFIPLAWVAQGIGETDRISFLWLAGCTVMYTLGEMYLSPIGLSLVTKVAPARIVSMMMGVWFLSSFFGGYMAGFFGTYYDKMPHSTFFLVLMAMGLAAGVAIFAVRKPLAKAVGHI